jgi:hypothetical protein
MKDFLSDREHSALPKGHGIAFSLILDTRDIMTCKKNMVDAEMKMHHFNHEYDDLLRQARTSVKSKNMT